MQGLRIRKHLLGQTERSIEMLGSLESERILSYLRILGQRVMDRWSNRSESLSNALGILNLCA